jgi:hypothetical protein
MAVFEKIVPAYSVDGFAACFGIAAKTSVYKNNRILTPG